MAFAPITAPEVLVTLALTDVVAEALGAKSPCTVVSTTLQVSPGPNVTRCMVAPARLFAEPRTET